MLLKNEIPYNILLVEDNLALNAVLTEIISGAGHNILSYMSAEEIPETLEYEIAILDLNLPGEDGLSLARRIRSSNADIGIILMTVRSELSDRLKGYNIGADVYLAKPVDSNELLAVLHSLGNRLSDKLSKKSTEDFNFKPLSDKELALLKHISKGLSYKESSAILGVSLSTVQTHIRSIYLKLGANSKIEAIENARHRKII
jgi:DNA-binding NarL/FixJ family response regulator